MLAIPAIDLREGAVVQLVGGDYDVESIRLDNPVAVARQWSRLGFPRLHCVDLDAATDRGTNHDVVRTLLDDNAAQYQVGGGVRTTERVGELIADGAAWIVAGTRALNERDWLAQIVAAHPGRVVVAADVRERRVVTHGWSETSTHDVITVVRDLTSLALGGILVTAVHREGQMRGTDLPLMEAVVRASACPVLASGGVTTLDDLRALDGSGVAGAVIGMALYTGALDARVVAAEFCQ